MQRNTRPRKLSLNQSKQCLQLTPMRRQKLRYSQSYLFSKSFHVEIRNFLSSDINRKNKHRILRFIVEEIYVLCRLGFKALNEKYKPEVVFLWCRLRVKQFILVSSRMNWFSLNLHHTYIAACILC